MALVALVELLAALCSVPLHMLLPGWRGTFSWLPRAVAAAVETLIQLGLCLVMAACTILAAVAAVPVAAIAALTLVAELLGGILCAGTAAASAAPMLAGAAISWAANLIVSVCQVAVLILMAAGIIVAAVKLGPALQVRLQAVLAEWRTGRRQIHRYRRRIQQQRAQLQERQTELARARRQLRQLEAQLSAAAQPCLGQTEVLHLAEPLLAMPQEAVPPPLEQPPAAVQAEEQQQVGQPPAAAQLAVDPQVQQPPAAALPESCPTCWQDISDDNYVLTLAACGHSFCCVCIAGKLKSCLLSDSTRPCCPDCRTRYSEREVDIVLAFIGETNGEDLAERLWQLYSSVIHREAQPGGQQIECLHCQAVFWLDPGQELCDDDRCIRCGHPPQQLPQAAAAAVAAHDAGSAVPAGAEALSQAGVEQQDPLVSQLPRCPSCNVPVERNGGCDHMTCSLCQTEFCYICGQRLQGNWADHFSLEDTYRCTGGQG